MLDDRSVVKIVSNALRSLSAKGGSDKNELVIKKCKFVLRSVFDKFRGKNVTDEKADSEKFTTF